jgi:respiratory-subunit NADH dehydrogenase subunit
MTGGVPYGRPMATRAPDRDGLELDKLDLRVGPFFPPLPRGLALDLQLQGDVIQEATVPTNPFRRVRFDPPGDVFSAALAGPVPIAEIELARARHHLEWLGGMLRVHGLAALGFRALALSRDVSLRSLTAVRELGYSLKRTRGLGWATSGVGVLPPATASAASGPVARAAGYVHDARVHDPAYEGLGFEPIVQRDGDARDRWRQRVAETVQALELATQAGDRHTQSLDQVESPRGVRRPSGSSWHTLVDALPTILEGQEWGDAVTTLVSLDLDMEVRA